MPTGPNGICPGLRTIYSITALSIQPHANIAGEDMVQEAKTWIDSFIFNVMRDWSESSYLESHTLEANTDARKALMAQPTFGR